MLRGEPAQDPVDFGAIGEMVEARLAVDLAAATAEVRHDGVPALRAAAIIASA